MSTTSDQNPWILRGGALATALVCWHGATVIWEGGSCPSSLLSTGLMLAGYLMGFMLLVVAVLERPPAATRWAIPIGLALVLACFAQNHREAQLEHGILTTDVRLYMDYAARLLRSGENPYEANLLEAYRLNRAPFNFSTPLLDGDLTGRVAYPALSILIFVPFQWLGVPAAWVYPLFLMAALALLYRWSPQKLRPLILLPLFIDPRYLLYSLGGVSDIVWALLLVAMLRAWSSPAQRGVWYGLACAFKHQPWLLAPFLLVRIWHEEAKGTLKERLQPLLRFAGFAIAGFAAVNLPFALWSPRAWFAGVFEPVVAPMITFGQGLSALTMFGRVAIPKPLFTLFLLGVLGLALFVYYRHYRQLRLLLWVAPGLALWFSHRSLTSYWYFYLLPLLYDLATSSPWGAAGRAEGEVVEGADKEAEPTTRPWRPTLVALGCGAGALLGGIILTAALPSQLELKLQAPVYTEGNHVTRLSVTLRNASRRPIKPRFAVQASGLQPFFWRIASGPAVLRPQREARYELVGDAPFTRFEVRRGARLTVSHAGSASLRASVQIAPDRSYVFPDSVPNGDFVYWSRHSGAPTFWGAVRPSPASTISLEKLAPSKTRTPRRALRFNLAAGSSSAHLLLDTYLALPQAAVELDVELPPYANRGLPAATSLYGLHLGVGSWRGLLLFGDTASQGKLADGRPYIVLKAPRGQWSTHRVDLPTLLKRLGAKLVPQRRHLPRFEHLDFPVVPINLQLYLARQGAAAALQARFGPLRSTAQRPQLGALFPRFRAQRAALPIWRGQHNFAMRNYDKARDAFARATKLAPGEPLAWRLLGEAEFWLGHWRPAIVAFGRALRLEPGDPLAYKGIGWAHYNLNEQEDALLAWKSAVMLFRRRRQGDERGHLVDTLKGMSLAYLRRGRCQHAKKAMEQARSLDSKVKLPRGLLEACQRRAAPR